MKKLISFRLLQKHCKQHRRCRTGPGWCDINLLDDCNAKNCLIWRKCKPSNLTNRKAVSE